MFSAPLCLRVTAMFIYNCHFASVLLADTVPCGSGKTKKNNNKTHNDNTNENNDNNNDGNNRNNKNIHQYAQECVKQVLVMLLLSTKTVSGRNVAPPKQHKHRHKR